MFSEPGQVTAKANTSPASTRSQAFMIAVGLTVLVLAAYLQVAGFPFVSYDDSLYITQNLIIEKGLTWQSVRYAFTTGSDGSWLPLVWLSHAACMSVFGTWAGGHHLVNLALHLANSLLLFYLLRRLTGSLWASAGVAFLFALHPLHVESVAWIAERKDVLSTLFWLLTIWAYTRYAQAPSVWRYLAMGGLFLLGLMSKSMLVTLPLTLLLMDIWPLQRLSLNCDPPVRFQRIAVLVLEKVPLLALSVAVGLITVWTQYQLGAMAPIRGYPLKLRLGNALMATGIYLKQTIWPVRLSVFYPIHPDRWSRWEMLGTGLVLIALTAWAFHRFRDRPYLAVGWSWYLITLLPVVGLLQVGAQAHADRYTYVPLIGIFIMICFCLEEVVPRWRIPRLALLVVGASLMAILFALTVTQVVVWRSNLTLFKNAFTYDGRNAVALLKFGEEYSDRGQWQDAYRLYLWARELWPSNALLHRKIGTTLEQMGRRDEAVDWYRTAKSINPKNLETDQLLGQALMAMDRYEEAAPFVKSVMEGGGEEPSIFLDPDAARVNWAIILLTRGKPEEAKGVLEGVLAKVPKSFAALTNLAIAQERLGAAKEAQVSYQAALEVQPENPEALYRFGMSQVKLGQIAEARQTFGRIEGVAPGHPLATKGLQACDSAPRP